MQLEVGQIFGGKYRILRRIGEGGMGEVYEGENVRIHRRVAIKTLHAGVAAKTETIQRFEREAQAAGRIGSEHIVEVLDLGELPDGTRFMVMEFLEGQTLQERIRSRGRLTPEEASVIVVQLLDGLNGAHQAGIIHRDLKPANVFLLTSKAGQKDFVKILDFGVSKFNVLNADEAMSMTRTGVVLGTPFYMSPEQAKGSVIDGRSDLYSVGVILYESITGQVPYSAETFNELLFKIVLESPPPAESFVPDLDPAFAIILRKAMAREVSERFASGAEFKQALTDWLAMKTKGGGAAAGQTVLLETQAGYSARAQNKTAALPAGLGIGVSGTVLIDAPGHQPTPAPAPVGMFHAAPPGMTPMAPMAAAPYGQPVPMGAPVAYAGYPGADVPSRDTPDAIPGVPKRRGAVLAVVLSVLGLLVIGGGAIVLLRQGESGASEAAAPPPPPPAQEGAPSEATAAPTAASTAEAAPPQVPTAVAAASAAASSAASAPQPGAAGSEPGIDAKAVATAPKPGAPFGSFGKPGPGHAGTAATVPTAGGAATAAASAGGFPSISPSSSAQQKGRKISSDL